MKLFLIRPSKNIKAEAYYDIENKTFIVLKDSILSETIAYSEKFRGAKSIEKSRDGVVDGNKLIKDMKFKSPSTAANFVTGASTNGLIAWKNEQGKTLKSIMENMEDNNE